MKKRWKAGFTAVEMLVVVLIVSLLTAGIITVSGAAVNVRSNELFASESEELAMTLNTALGDMLHYATGVKTGEGNRVVGLTNLNYGIKNGSFLLQNEQLYLNTTAATAENNRTLPLVSAGTYTNMKLESFSITYDRTQNLFQGSYEIKGPRDNQKKEIQFVFRPMNQPEVG